jgi:hypothetical protein
VALKQADQRMYEDKLSRTGRPPRHLLGSEGSLDFPASSLE